MAAAALARSAKCQACRRDVLQSFVRISGLSITQTLRPPNKPQTRCFFTVPNLRSEAPNPPSEDAIKHESTQNTTTLNNSAKLSQPVPWYLQVEPATEATHPAAKKQEIPAVPENAPPIMHEMLQYLADEIGLEDLALLDLRGRDPPSALGVNLIMLIGSARSVKHLNVSADRFCRWLRSTYKLRPYADGLLGRNELKIKLRRKVRRARLASSSGAVADSSDDGITTGWICVNVGSVDDPSNIQNLREGNFEGFGKVQGGTRIVVQMFTEEKRADVDLEKLWAPKQENKAQSSETSNESIVEEEHRARSELGLPAEYNSDQPAQISRSPPQSVIDQRRGFSTSCSRKDSIAGHLHRPFGHGVHEGNEEDEFRGHAYSYLKGLSPEEVIKQLGNGPEDRNSTNFLRKVFSFDEAGPGSYRMESTLRLILAAAGVSAQHPNYSKEYLWALFLDHSSSGFKLPPSQAYEIASAFVTPRLEVEEGKTIPRDLIEFDIESALRVLDLVSLKGFAMIQDQRVFSVLYKILILRSQYEDAKSIQEKSLRIRNLMTTSGKVKHNLEFDREIMQLRMQVGDVDGFYEIWHALAFNEGNRLAEQYEFLFRVHADAGDAAHARECLAVWIPMMGREDPKITPQDDLLSAIARCAHVAYRSPGDILQIPFPEEWEEALPLITERMRLLEDSA